MREEELEISEVAIDSGNDFVIEFTGAVDPEGKSIDYEIQYYNENGLQSFPSWAVTSNDLLMVTLNTPPIGYHKFANIASDGLQEVLQFFTVNVIQKPQNDQPAFISTWFGSDAKLAFDEGFKPFLTDKPDVSSCDLKWFSNQEIREFDRFTTNGIKKIGAAQIKWNRARNRIQNGMTQLLKGLFVFLKELNENCKSDFIKKFYYLTRKAKMEQRSFQSILGREFAIDVRDRGVELLEPLQNAYQDKNLEAYMSELAPFIIDMLEFS